MAENTHKVGKSQWKKWSENSQKVFNDLYEMGLQNQRLFKHPEAPVLEDRYWKTTAWNFAWMAASFIDENTKDGGPGY